MISVDYNLEKILSNLQSLSERISDLVNKGDFSQIEILDNERQIIISHLLMNYPINQNVH